MGWDRLEIQGKVCGESSDTGHTRAEQVSDNAHGATTHAPLTAVGPTARLAPC